MNDADTINAAGLAAMATGNTLQAIEHFKLACQAAPDDAGWHLNLGVAYYKIACESDSATDAAQQALAAWQTALDLHDPERVSDLHSYIGAAYGLLGDYVQALYHFDYASDTFFTLHRKALYNFQLGRFEQALEAQDKSITFEADDASAHFNRANIYLHLGRLTEGWQEYTWRHAFDDSTAAKMRSYRPDAQHWQGGDIKDQNLWLLGEQGFGDVLQYARYIPHYQNLCEKLNVYAPAECLSLLRMNFPGVEFADDIAEDCTHYTFMMDAGLHFDLSDFSRAPPSPYLSIDPNPVWHERLSSPLPNVGLVWTGRAGALMDKQRSMQFEEFKPLFDLPFHFVSLQKHASPRPYTGEARGQSQMFPVPDLTQYRVLDVAPHLHTWLDTAQAIEALDLLITVDTSVAHLAGAMGKPVWMISRANSCWRWGQTGSQTPWYSSMRIFRQPTRGDWASVVNTIRGELATIDMRLPLHKN